MNLNKILENSQLTLEQQFKLTTDKSLLEKASKEQLLNLYSDAIKLLMIKENMIREILKEDLLGNKYSNNNCYGIKEINQYL